MVKCIMFLFAFTSPFTKPFLVISCKVFLCVCVCVCARMCECVCMCVLVKPLWVGHKASSKFYIPLPKWIHEAQRGNESKLGG